MAFLRTLFWIVLTVIVVVFSLRNWVPVTINLFGDLRADVKLPVLLLVVFLAGFLPPFLWHQATRWRHGRPAGAAQPAPTVPAPVIQPPPAEPGFGPASAD